MDEKPITKIPGVVKITNAPNHSNDKFGYLFVVSGIATMLWIKGIYQEDIDTQKDKELRSLLQTICELDSFCKYDSILLPIGALINILLQSCENDFSIYDNDQSLFAKIKPYIMQIQYFGKADGRGYPLIKTKTNEFYMSKPL